MARVQSVDDKAVFVFVGDANAHHSEWLESASPTDRHGREIKPGIRTRNPPCAVTMLGIQLPTVRPL